jgi:hypothetical protein
MMKRIVAVLLVIVLAVSVFCAVLFIPRPSVEDEFYFGVSLGPETVDESKVMIDKVKDYTNLFLINSWTIATDEALLNETCDYARQAGLKFMVYFDLISRVAYRFHQNWLGNASKDWGDSFLGIHLRDEMGGRQIDDDSINKTVAEAADYSDAANRFIANITSSNSMTDAKSKDLHLFISDYALYWWDYLAGYNTVLVELGWYHNTTQHIALCRGAANMQGKDWGAIIVWRSYDAPYLGSGEEIYADMITAYRAGAKYVIVFNFPTYPEGNPYGILQDDHFDAMQQFWDYVQTHPRDANERIDGKVAFVLPKDYGWGMRSKTDNIWGLWPADEKAAVIWENMNKLITKYGLTLDIVYDDERFDVAAKYNTVYNWNATID